MSTETTPAPSIEQELASEFAALSAAAVKMPGDIAAEAAPAETKATEDPAKPAEVKTTEPKPADVSMARRLSIVARGEREAKAAKEEAERTKAELGPIAEKLKAAKASKSKFDAVKMALDLDDEGMAELFLEMHDNHSGIRDKALKEETAEEKTARLVKETVENALKARDEARSAETAKSFEADRAAYASETLTALESMSDRFPLVAIAPPSAVDITTIAEAWLVANKAIPEPEEVLKLIQSERQERFEKASKKPEGNKTASTSTSSAPGKPGEVSGQKPIRDNDVAVGGAKKLTIAEEFAALFAQAPQ